MARSLLPQTPPHGYTTPKRLDPKLSCRRLTFSYGLILPGCSIDRGGRGGAGGSAGDHQREAGTGQGRPMHMHKQGHRWAAVKCWGRWHALQQPWPALPSTRNRTHQAVVAKLEAVVGCIEAAVSGC